MDSIYDYNTKVIIKETGQEIYQSKRQYDVFNLNDNELNILLHSLPDKVSDMTYLFTDMSIQSFVVNLQNDAGIMHLFYEYVADDIPLFYDNGNEMDIKNKVFINASLISHKNGVKYYPIKCVMGTQGGQCVNFMEATEQNIAPEHIEIFKNSYKTYMRIWVSIQRALLFGNQIFDIEEKQIKNKSSKKKGSTKKRKSVVRLFKCYTLKKDAKTKLDEIPKTPHKYKALAWSVRGHYRHYKNGTIVFVKPHIKGKDKTKYEGKEYQLFPK